MGNSAEDVMGSCVTVSQRTREEADRMRESLSPDVQPVKLPIAKLIESASVTLGDG